MRVKKRPEQSPADEFERMRSQHSAPVRWVACALIALFVLQDAALAQGGSPVWSGVAEVQAESARTIQDDDLLGRITVPHDSGLVRKIAANGTENILINVQDAHTKIGAQHSIAKILDNLVKNYDLKLVAMEGAASMVDTSIVSAFPVAQARRTAGEFLMKEGRISAGEFYAMISDNPVKLYGAEDPELYRANLEVFKDLVANKAAVRKELQGLARAVSELEAKVYSQPLREIAGKTLIHRKGDIRFSEYWDFFSRLARTHGVDYTRYANLNKLARTVSLEKEIDFVQAGLERDRLMKELEGKLSKDDLAKLILAALQFKRNRITPGAFHLTLSRLAQAAAINPLTGKNIIRYSQYVVLYESIDLIAIFEEAELFEAELRRRLFANSDERLLADLARSVGLLSRLLDTTLAGADYAEYERDAASCEVAAIRQTLCALASRYAVPAETYVDFDALERAVPSARKFYELASARNKALLENTLARMKTEGVRVAALVSGGFHSEGISELLDQKRLSYMVVMPKFAEDSGDRPYIAIITQKPSAYEKEFAGSDYYLAAASFLSGQIGVYGPSVTQAQLKTMLAAVVGCRLAGQGRALTEGELEEFLQNVERMAYAQGGFFFETNVRRGLRRLRGLLKRATVKRRGSGSFLVSFGGGQPYLVVMNPDGSIGSIQPQRPAALPKAAARLASESTPIDGPRPDSRRSEGPRTSWVAVHTPNLDKVTVVTRQFEQGLHPALLEKMREKFPDSMITDLLAQTTLTGGLGALMCDLVDAWKLNGMDVVSINTIYESIKGQKFINPADLPQEVRSGDKTLGEYVRETLGDVVYEFNDIRLDFGDAFRFKAQGKARDIADSPIQVRVYKTETSYGTPIYYLDARYRVQTDKGEQWRAVFDEVYPDADADNNGSYLWRDVHMAVYSKASQLIIKRLQSEHLIKDELAIVDNEVFVSMPLQELKNAVRMHINHTVFRPGLYRPDEASYEMLGYPDWDRVSLVTDDHKISVVDAVATATDVITGVGLYEHLPVLGRDIMAAYPDKLQGWRLEGVRSTNGALIEHWRAPDRQSLLSTYKRQLGLPHEAWEVEATDRDLARAFEKSENQTAKKSFMKRNDYISAASVARFLLWLKNEQQNGSWLESIAASEEELLGLIQAVTQATQSEKDEDWVSIETTFGEVCEKLLAQPIVSNIRRQVSYKGPDKWIELLQFLGSNPAELDDFRKNSCRIVIGGRVFGEKAQSEFDAIKRLIKVLDLGDKITTIENYNIDAAPLIFQAMAGTVMLSDEWLEASATSMMKGALNFAKYIGVWGGAMPEIFAILDKDTQQAIDVFGHNGGKPVTHDQLLAKLTSGEWVMPNGELVQYADDEKSREQGGGRRPSAVRGRGLLAALKALNNDYADPESRRKTQYTVWSYSESVDMQRSQARAHAFLLDQAIRDRIKRRELFSWSHLTQDPKASPEAVQQEARAVQRILGNPSSFGWHDLGDLKKSDGLLGFVESIRMLRTKGAKAYESVRYHALNKTAEHPDGDIFYYLKQNLLKDGGVWLGPIRGEINRLADEARATNDEYMKVTLNFKALDLVAHLVEELAWRALLYYKDCDQETRELVDDWMKDIRMKENLIRYLDRRAQSLETTSDNFKVYAVTFDDQPLIVAVNWREFVYSSDSGQKARTTLRPKGVRAVLGNKLSEDSKGRRLVNGRPAVQALNVVTGNAYKSRPIEDVLRLGLPIGAKNVQILRLVPSDDKAIERVSRINQDNAIQLIKAAIQGEFIKDSKGSERLAVEVLKQKIQQIRGNPTIADREDGFKRFLETLTSLNPEEAIDEFEDAMPAVMALIAVLCPNAMESISKWDDKVGPRLKELKDLIEPRKSDQTDPDFYVHETNPKTGLVLSRSGKGESRVIVAFHFADTPVHVDGKVWLALSDLPGIRSDSQYMVGDCSPGSQHFQILAIRPDNSEFMDQFVKINYGKRSGADLVGRSGQPGPQGLLIGVPVSVGARLASPEEATARLADNATLRGELSDLAILAHEIVSGGVERLRGEGWDIQDSQYARIEERLKRFKKSASELMRNFDECRTAADIDAAQPMFGLGLSVILNFAEFVESEFSEAQTPESLLTELPREGIHVDDSGTAIDKLNHVLNEFKLWETFPNAPLSSEGKKLRRYTQSDDSDTEMSKLEKIKLNRLVLESLYPEHCPKMPDSKPENFNKALRRYVAKHGDNTLTAKYVGLYGAVISDPRYRLLVARGQMDYLSALINADSQFTDKGIQELQRLVSEPAVLLQNMDEEYQKTDKAPDDRIKILNDLLEQLLIFRGSLPTTANGRTIGHILDKFVPPHQYEDPDGFSRLVSSLQSGARLAASSVVSSSHTQHPHLIRLGIRVSDEAAYSAAVTRIFGSEKTPGLLFSVKDYFSIVRVTSPAETFMQTAPPGSINGLIDNPNAIKDDELVGALTRLIELRQERQTKIDADSAGQEVVYEWIAQYLQGGTADIGEGVQKALGELYAQLPQPKLYGAVGTSEHVRIWIGATPISTVLESAAKEIAQGVRSTLRTRNLDELRLSLASAITYLGNPDSEGFVDKAAALIEALRELREEQQALESPLTEDLEGSKTILHHESVFAMDRAFYASEVAELKRRADEAGIRTNLKQVLLVSAVDTDLAGLSEADRLSRYLERYPKAGCFDAVIFDAEKDMRALQARYPDLIKAQFIAVGTQQAGLRVEPILSEDKGKVALVVSLHEKARTTRDLVMIAGLLILNPGKDFKIPGLSKVAEGVYELLQEIRPLDLLRQLAEANRRDRDVRAAA